MNETLIPNWSSNNTVPVPVRWPYAIANDYPPTGYMPVPDPSPRDMLVMRLGGQSKVSHMFELVSVYQAAVDRFFIWVIANDKQTTLEDGALFPSDQLITQLKLIKKEG